LSRVFVPSDPEVSIQQKIFYLTTALFSGAIWPVAPKHFLYHWHRLFRHASKKHGRVFLSSFYFSDFAKEAAALYFVKPKDIFRNVLLFLHSLQLKQFHQPKALPILLHRKSANLPLSGLPEAYC